MAESRGTSDSVNKSLRAIVFRDFRLIFKYQLTRGSHPTNFYLMMFSYFKPTQAQLDAIEERAKRGGSFDFKLWDAFLAADGGNRAKMAYMFPWLRPLDEDDEVHRSHIYDPIWIESVENHNRRVYFAVKASQVKFIRELLEDYKETNLSTFAEWFAYVGTIIQSHDSRIIDIKNV